MSEPSPGCSWSSGRRPRLLTRRHVCVWDRRESASAGGMTVSSSPLTTSPAVASATQPTTTTASCLNMAGEEQAIPLPPLPPLDMPPRSAVPPATTGTCQGRMDGRRLMASCLGSPPPLSRAARRRRSRFLSGGHASASASAPRATEGRALPACRPFHAGPATSARRLGALPAASPTDIVSAAGGTARRGFGEQDSGRSSRATQEDQEVQVSPAGTGSTSCMPRATSSHTASTCTQDEHAGGQDLHLQRSVSSQSVKAWVRLIRSMTYVASQWAWFCSSPKTPKPDSFCWSLLQV